jgi:Flp pilus assembly protein CpaB
LVLIAVILIVLLLFVVGAGVVVMLLATRSRANPMEGTQALPGVAQKDVGRERPEGP